MSSMFLNIVSTFKSDGITAATRQLGAFGKQTSGLGLSLGKVGASLASFGLIAKTVQFTSDSIDSARDLERNLFSVNTIFGELAPRMVAFTKSSESFGLSQKDSAKAVTFLGSVLKSSGFEMTTVASETENLVRLATDLATTYGYDVQEALTGMTALFRGEYDPIEKFGVAMKQNEINSELAARGQDKLTGAARRHAEQVIRLELLYQRAADASGAFAKQSGNLFVEQKKLSAAWENMQATIGTQLLPAMGDLVDALKPLVDELTPRLVQVVSDAKPGLEVFTQLIRDMGDTSTTTGATVSFLADTLGQVFRLVSENFGVLLQLTGLILGVNAAVRLVSAALIFINAHPVIAGLTLLAGAFLLVNDRANNLKYTIDTTGKSVTSFKTALHDTAKESKWASEKYGVVATTFQKGTKEALRLADAVRNADKAKLDNLKQAILGIKISATAAAGEIERMARYAGVKVPGATTPPPTPGTDGQGDGKGGGSAKKKETPLADFLKKLKEDGKRVKLEAKLIGAGLSEGLAKQLASSLPIKKIEAVLKKIVETGGKYAKKLQKLWNATAAGIAELQGSIEDTTAKDALADANKGIIDAIKSLLDVFKAPKPELGVFQQQVVDAFDGIFEAIRTRFTNKRKQTQFLGVATFVKQQLELIAKQRDEIAAKIEKSKSFMSSVIDSIISPMDITKLGKSAAQIMANLRRTIEQTLNFRKQIQALSDLGLGKNAIQQIVQAGAIEGGATAEALIAGGPEAINQINALYSELGTTAETFAETAGQAVYGAGVDISNGLIAGLLAQDAALRQAATTLGNSFSTYFKRALGISLRPETMDITAAGTTRAGTVINLTVTAPYSSRPQDFGRIIVNAISDFERQSGPVFVRA